MTWTRRWQGRAGIAMTVAVAATLALLVAATGTFGAGDRTCNDRKAKIVGTSGNDTIQGTNGTDVIVGGRGNDLIRGLGGDDVICGGPGRDDIIAGSGDDELSGGAGDDALFGGSGDDFLAGGNGGDSLSGGSGQDELVPDDVLPGKKDSCDGGDGSNDTARGGCESTTNVP
jgi:Ca2+-binding RTX toxin-like protein